MNEERFVVYLSPMDLDLGSAHGTFCLVGITFFFWSWFNNSVFIT